MLEAKTKASKPKKPYQPHYPAQAHKLCLLGATDSDIASFFGVCRSTLTNWKKLHADFKEAITQGKKAADMEVASSLYQATIDRVITCRQAIKCKEIYYDDNGNWAATLGVEISGNSASLITAGYTNQLEHGRAPGKQPPSAAIEQWIKSKGIAARIEGKIAVTSLAYLIARKIAKKGWNRSGYGGTELISSVVTPERIQLIIDKAAQAELSHFTNDILNYLNSAL